MRIQTSTHGFLFPAFARTGFAGMAKKPSNSIFL